MHLTKGEGDTPSERSANARRILEEILLMDQNGECLLKGNSSGLFVKAAQEDPQLDYLIQSVSFTETPLEHVQLFCLRYSDYGLVFGREFIRRNGGNPVFYISTEHGDQLKRAALDLIKGGDFYNRDFTYLLPFFSIFGKDAAGKTHDYYWEREWRVPGGLRFKHEDVLLGLVQNQTDLSRFWRIAPSVPFACADWSLDWKMFYLKERKSYRQIRCDRARDDDEDDDRDD
jgi:hypothetical protein